MRQHATAARLCNGGSSARLRLTYGRPGEANPEYGFARWGEVELPTPSMPLGRPPRLPAVSARPGTRRMDWASLATSIPRAICYGSARPCDKPRH